MDVLFDDALHAENYNEAANMVLNNYLEALRNTYGGNTTYELCSYRDGYVFTLDPEIWIPNEDGSPRTYFLSTFKYLTSVHAKKRIESLLDNLRQQAAMGELHKELAEKGKRIQELEARIAELEGHKGTCDPSSFESPIEPDFTTGVAPEEESDSKNIMDIAAEAMEGIHG
ncbi:MAG: hypothetical protein F4118_00515, partial [Acidimicrobiaceae bacterium]|nr:hypothetical protein [Acidimicrobiaceae bacterium]